MIEVIQVSTSYGNLNVELNEPVETEEEALDAAIKMIKEDVDYFDVAQTW